MRTRIVMLGFVAAIGITFDAGQAQQLKPSTPPTDAPAVGEAHNREGFASDLFSLGRRAMTGGKCATDRNPMVCSLWVTVTKPPRSGVVQSGCYRVCERCDTDCDGRVDSRPVCFEECIGLNAP